jgi:hypothetical protein
MMHRETAAGCIATVLVERTDCSWATALRLANEMLDSLSRWHAEIGEPVADATASDGTITITEQIVIAPADT